MTKRPETRYARSGDVSIAYQVFGEGDMDLVMIPGFISHLEVEWDEPPFVAAMERMGRFARVIRFDKRGTGMSDPVAELPSLEVRMDDVRAVMDAAGSERAALFGFSEGCAMGALFAATYPERTTALVLYGGLAKGIASEDYPWGPPPEILDPEVVGSMKDDWGKGYVADIFLPSIADMEGVRQMVGRMERMAASPGVLFRLYEMFAEIDVRHVLPVISVPTLLLHRTGDRATNVGNSRWMAEQIPEAKFIEFEGIDHHLWIGNTDEILDEIEEFLTGAKPTPEPDRILATVMFTDIVDSTKKATELGDKQWRETLLRHQDITRQELDRHRGREVKTTGDGFLATFDGPARGVRCAQAICEGVRPLGVEVRAGLHCGECEVLGDDIGGIAVHIASRVGSNAGAGEVLVSRTVKDLVAGSGISFEDRGTHTLKGIPDPWNLYAAAL